MAGYVVDRSSFRGMIAVFHIDVAGYIVDHYCLMFYREVNIVVAGYILDHYCLMFDRGVVHIVVDVILLSITV
jgi:hypothetical protein